MFGERPAELPQRFVFVLLEQFSMLPVMAAIDPMRLANRASGRELYSWEMARAGAHPATASNGISPGPQIDLDAVAPGASIVVCGGLSLEDANGRRLAGWLRRRARLGTDIGALCTGSYFLAHTGLLDGYTCTIHWENLTSFSEAFPDAISTEHLFEVDRNRFTCSGGAAAIDMMLAMITEQHGPELARDVAEQIIYSAVRASGDEQRSSAAARVGVRHPRLALILSQMEDNIEDPVSPRRLAQEAGLSARQLERLFRRYLGRSPKRYYLELRLKRARRLLLQTDWPVVDVAIACGFTTSSHFSKCYRGYFGSTPYRERGLPGGATTAGAAGSDGGEPQPAARVEEPSSSLA